MKTLRYISVAALSAALFYGCGKGSKSGDAADSVAADTAAVVEEPVEALPDTAYASAEKVNARVTVIDTLTDGTVPPGSRFYELAKGSVLTFRNDPQRNAAFGGRVKGTPSEIVVDWTFTTQTDNRDTGVGHWGGGTGWTGQPLYVQWPDSCVKAFRAEGVVNADFNGREIIFGSLASRLYFVNFETGKATREPVDVGNPIKGTPSVDPTFNGNVYVGQGVPAQRPFGALVVDLHSNKVTDVVPEDPRALRHWGAYDSSPVRLGNFVFRPGENGILYKYMVAPGRLIPHSTLNYTVGGAAPGMECSMAVYRNYGYVGDNHGHVLCVNLSTMKPVWYYALGDDIDASPVLTVEDGAPYVYFSCEVDRRGDGDARFVKLNALNGDEVWVNATPARKRNADGKHFDGGFYASPLPGIGDCSDLIFTNCVLNTSGSNGRFMAIDRKTGKTVYTTPLKIYSWSSPVGFLNENNKMFVVTADGAGNIYLIEGRSGKILVTKSVGNNFESSPVVIGNSLVVGSRGNSIFKLSIK
ncbi:MAG: PQQ-binding-like beta-propeller repeat protein [Bacteroidales bacterium]|nr:PQQ-binding-like beta-propeller repeat protein [Bacteroidales bacterium]